MKKHLKLICLNIWGGHVGGALMEFIGRHREVDVFCFQEVYHNAEEKISSDELEVHLRIFEEIGRLLPDHKGYFRPVVDDIYGIGMFVKKSIKVEEETSCFIHENPSYAGKGPTHSRVLQCAKCLYEGKHYTIINVHGLWNGKGKTDSPERLEQSDRIIEFLKKVNSALVVCGDFNLRPDTESLKRIETGMVNWVLKRGVQSTRTSLYTKPERFADYILTCPEVEVQEFEVLPDEVSDHAPLYLEFR